MSTTIVLRPRLKIDPLAHPRLFIAINSRSNQDLAALLAVFAEEGVKVLEMRAASAPGYLPGTTDQPSRPPIAELPPPALTPDASPPAAPLRQNAFLQPGADLLGALAAFNQPS